LQVYVAKHQQVLFSCQSFSIQTIENVSQTKLYDVICKCLLWSTEKKYFYEFKIGQVVLLLKNNDLWDRIVWVKRFSRQASPGVSVAKATF